MPDRTRIDLCIPAYNEEAVIKEAVGAVRAALAPYEGARVVVAVNGSSDATATRAEKAGATVLTLEERGKGAAIRAAALESSAEVFGFIDADLSADPADVPALLAPVLRGECDIAAGSRLVDEGLVRREFQRTLSSRIFNLLRRALVGANVQDSQCGLKVMNERGKGVLAECTERGWFFDMEFLALAEKRHLRVKEVPVHWDEHRFPERKSKLRPMRDAFGALAAMVRIRRALKRAAGGTRPSF